MIKSAFSIILVLLFTGCSCFQSKKVKIFDTNITGDKVATGCIKKLIGIPIVNQAKDWKELVKNSDIVFPTSAYLDTFKVGVFYESNCIEVRGKEYDVHNLKSIFDHL